MYLLLYLQYFVIVLVIFGVLLVGGVLGFVYRSKANTVVRNTLISKMRDYDRNGNQLDRAWDDTQVQNMYMYLYYHNNQYSASV